MTTVIVILAALAVVVGFFWLLAACRVSGEANEQAEQAWQKIREERDGH